MNLDWLLQADYGSAPPNWPAMILGLLLAWGVLDEAGQATAELTVPAGLSLAWAGLNLYHAVAIYDGAVPRPYSSAPLLQSGVVTVHVGGAPGQ